MSKRLEPWDFTLDRFYLFNGSPIESQFGGSIQPMRGGSEGWNQLSPPQAVTPRKGSGMRKFSSFPGLPRS